LPRQRQQQAAEHRRRNTGAINAAHCSTLAAAAGNPGAYTAVAATSTRPALMKQPPATRADFG
jgi:hypothetical protein